MAHGTLIGGAAYGITGGKCLVGGTEYAIKKGRTLVGGTGYDIVFGKPTNVSILRDGDDRFIYAVINGVKHYTITELNFEAGETVTLKTYLECTGTTSSQQLFYNGEIVEAGNRRDPPIEKEFDITGLNIEIEMKRYSNGTVWMDINEV